MKIFEIPEVNVLFTSIGLLKHKKRVRDINKNSLNKIIQYVQSKSNPYTLFLWQYYALQSDYSWSCLKPKINQILREVPDLNIVVCCNDMQTLNSVPKEYGSRFSGILCNHNATVSRKIFNIKICNKIWDCVYTARMCEFKRHHLSYELSNVLYLTSGSKYLHPYTKEGHLSLIANQNNPFTLYYQHIDKEEINNLLNKSKIGLCLSGIEGAMYSSVEYLLCGLPIVSTKSIGGRDVFFTENNCLIADDNAGSVAASVKKLLLHYPTLEQRESIRQNAINIQKEHTKKLKDKLKKISSADINIDKLYKEKFVHKLNLITEI
tara:strand:- start:4633 stop:5595 length:963 start_codon:yes stop_codon:yes gene_type:complete